MRPWPILLFLVLLLQACKPSKPGYVLSEKKMEDIMVDYHLAQGMAEVQGGNREVQTYKNIQAVFRKHGVSEERFDSSLIYYSTYSEKMAEIYKRVTMRVETMASLMGVDAQTAPKDIYAELTEEGDTANIWREQNFCALQPNKLQNIYSFHIQADSTYRLGDSFLWRFNTSFRLQGSLFGVYSILLVRYEREGESDTVASVSQDLRDSRLYELRHYSSPALDSLAIKSISGYVYWPEAAAKDAKDFSLLILNNISLIRFHKEETEIDSTLIVQPDSVDTDTLSAVEVQKPAVRLSPTELRERQPREQKQRIRHESPVDPSLLNPQPQRRNVRNRRR